jgi:hypothetical protein
MLKLLARKLLTCLSEKRSVAALEAAVIAPFFLFLFIGSFEILLLMRTSEKLNTLTGNVAEMVASSSSPSGNSVTNGILSDYCQGALQGLQPLPGLGLTIDIASVTIVATPKSGTSNSDHYWETDFSGANCTATPGGSGIGSAKACSLVSNSNGGLTGGMLPESGGVIGDNAIVVKTTLTYAGMTSQPGVGKGWLINFPALSQTAFDRWHHSSSSTELTLSGTTPTAITCP